MKNKIYLLFLFSGLLCSGTIRAQWSIEKCPSINNLNGIAFTSQNAGWIVGDKGTILLRTNNQWTEWQKPTTENLHSICMVDDHYGWVVGDKGTILHFDGNTWLPFNSPTNKNLFSVSFNDANHGVAVGDFGTVLIFKDGTWNQAESGSRARLLSVNFKTDNAWIGGGLECVKVPLMKINVNNKDKNPGNVMYSYASINGISFSDPNNGWAVGSPSTLLHFDGQRWEKVFATKNHSALKSVFFSDENNGISVGYSGTILTFIDGSWTKENSLSSRDLKAGTINGDTYYAIGDSGTILTAKILPEKSNIDKLLEGLKGNFRLYPNPCNDVLNILLSDSYTNKSVLISITNMLGQVLLQMELNITPTNKSLQLNTSQFSKGTYQLRVVDGSSISETKFIILR
jgi:photosystem II stability/assembly factor-like uncharacterized protein